MSVLSRRRFPKMESWRSSHCFARNNSTIYRMKPCSFIYLTLLFLIALSHTSASPISKPNHAKELKIPARTNKNNLLFNLPNTVSRKINQVQPQNIEFMQQKQLLLKTNDPKSKNGVKVGVEVEQAEPVKGSGGIWGMISQWECSLCKLVVTFVRTLSTLKKTRAEIANALTKFCIDLKIEDQKVCTAVILEFKDEVLDVIEKLALSPAEICGFIFGDQCAKTYNPYAMWNVSFPDKPKPPVKPPVPPKPGSPVIRVLQLSDIHLDLDYQSGSNAECGEPLCCHKNDGPPEGKPAGHWGDYRQCDTPPWLLENLFQHLKEKEKFDYIYWTGDLPSHLVWNQTRRGQQRLEAHLTKLLIQYFPNTLILSSIGNHESAPANSFPPPFIKGDQSISWLYKTLASNWTVWLPNTTVHDILKGGYYTMLVKPGFRVVSVNTNYCNNMNWWLLLNTTDPAEELQWLIKVLQAAEDNKEKVHILGHIPTGINSCLQAWSWNYYKIISRYENTVAGQFFGHTHTDSVTMYYDDVTFKRPVSVSYVSPSVTTYAGSIGTNPSYRIYEVDGGYNGASWEVLNHHTYMINLTEANLKPEQPPQWYKEYDAKTAYNMTSVYPRDWNQVFEKMKTDDTLFTKYYKFYYHGHPPDGVCDKKCKHDLLCEARSGRSYDEQHLCGDLTY